MRNWHHKIIQLDEALALITVPQPVAIAIIEGQIEYKTIPANLLGFNYEAVNEGLNDPSGGVQKVFYVRQAIPINVKVYSGGFLSSPHATSTAGVVGGNVENPAGTDLPIKGIINNALISNARVHLTSFLMTSGVDWNIFSANSKALNLNNALVGGLNLNPAYSFGTDNYSPPQLSASVINASVAFPESLWKAPRSNDNDALRSVVNHVFDTVKAYSRDGRGALICLAAGNLNTNTTDEQFLSNYDYPFIVAASGINNEKTAAGIQEIRASYSDKGDQIDLCAPSSGGVVNNKLVKRHIYTTTNAHSGDVGTDNEVERYIIQAVISLNTLRLNSIEGLFPGHCVEIGISGSIEHEIMVIDTIDSTTNTITFTEDRYYTDGAAILNNEVRVPILKTGAYFIVTAQTPPTSPPPTSPPPPRSRIRVTDPKGFGFPGQDIYIKNGTSGHYAKITSMFNDAFEFNPLVPSSLNLPQNFEVIPGQVVLTVDSTRTRAAGAETYEFITDGETNRVKMQALFIGEMVELSGVWIEDDNNSAVTLRVHIEALNPGAGIITITKLPANFLATIKINTMKTIGYGSYTSGFGGTSSASPTVAGLAGLLLQANPNLNVLELKHILKLKAAKIAGSYSMITNQDRKNYGYTANNLLGTGRINALDSVSLALNWSTEAKPRLEVYDAPGNAAVLTGIVDSPDIWIASNPTVPNGLDLTKNQDKTIKVRVHNGGNRESFRECDARLLIAFIPPLDAQGHAPDFNFPFPDYWYSHLPDPEKNKDPRIVLLGVKDIGIIAAGGAQEIEFTFTNRALQDIINTNRLSGHRIFLLAHIAPFDGTDSEISLTDIRSNKQLTCREIIVTNIEIKQGSSYLPGNSLDIIAESGLTQKSFDLEMQNILSTELNATTIKVTRTRDNEDDDEALFSKINDVWKFESAAPDWIFFQTPVETDGYSIDHKNAVFTHTIAISPEKQEVKIEIINNA